MSTSEGRVAFTIHLMTGNKLTIKADTFSVENGLIDFRFNWSAPDLHTSGTESAGIFVPVSSVEYIETAEALDKS